MHCPQHAARLQSHFPNIPQIHQVTQNNNVQPKLETE